jgi:RpiB/LacA/LacB family sugar-phosphate isomerase
VAGWKRPANPSAHEDKMKIGIGADHGGFEMKQKLADLLTKSGHEVVDFGNRVYDPNDDYPDFGIPLACAIASGEIHRGILICASGVGIAVTANKVKGVRAALCHDEFSARQGVEDDNMNVICLGGTTTGIAVAWNLAASFLEANFSGAERHRRRLAKVAQLEADATPCVTNNQQVESGAQTEDRRLQ